MPWLGSTDCIEWSTEASLFRVKSCAGTSELPPPSSPSLLRSCTLPLRATGLNVSKLAVLPLLGMPDIRLSLTRATAEGLGVSPNESFLACERGVVGELPGGY